MFWFFDLIIMLLQKKSLIRRDEISWVSDLNVLRDHQIWPEVYLFIIILIIVSCISTQYSQPNLYTMVQKLIISCGRGFFININIIFNYDLSFMWTCYYYSVQELYTSRGNLLKTRLILTNSLVIWALHYRGHNGNPVLHILYSHGSSFKRILCHFNDLFSWQEKI